MSNDTHQIQQVPYLQDTSENSQRVSTASRHVQPDSPRTDNRRAQAGSFSMARNATILPRSLQTGFWRTARTSKGIPLATEWGTRVTYRLAEYEGLLGNRKEATWSKTLREHTCCGARVSWRHKVSCPNRSQLTIDCA